VEKRILKLQILMLLSMFLQSCYSPITGKVVDAESGDPIEGAVIMIEWTKTKGIGLTHTESYKVVEVLTDKEGKVMIPGVDSVFANLARVAVYKKGYVLWSNNNVFKGSRQLTNFEWKNNYTFELNRFKPEYSYIDHTSFISRAISAGFGNKKKIMEAYRWERKKASEERSKARHK
jgi:hypothetical protein